jgi:hypothetical protein
LHPWSLVGTRSENQELSDIVTRRFARHSLKPSDVEKRIEKWTTEGLLPKTTDWKSSELADVLTAWLDAPSLAPGYLAAMLRLRAKAGLLPQEANLSADDLDAACPEGSAGRPHEQLSAFRLFFAPGRRIEELQAFLKDCSIKGVLSPRRLFAGRDQSEPPHGAAGKDCADETSEEAEGQRRMNEEFGRKKPSLDQGSLIVNALVLEALLRREVSRDLVGLALSGGGIRSASFNLGLLQSLQKSELLEDVDYLSTVSGGGFVGSLLSSLVCRKEVASAPEPSQGSAPPAGDAAKRQSSDKGSGHAILAAALVPDTDEKQPERVVKLVRSGSYLNKPAHHLSRYLIGVLLNNLVLFSALLALCALVALAWRWLDTYPTAEWLHYYSAGWIGDWYRPFVPALAVFLVWAAVAALSLAWFGDRAAPTVARVLLVAGGICWLIGLAVWLATPNIRVPLARSQSHEMPRLLALEDHPLLVLSVLVLLGMLPFLRPSRFLVSGTQPNPSTFERMAFRVLSVALLIGIPFCIVYVLSRHNIRAEMASLTPAFDPRKDDDDSTWRWQLHSTDIQFDRWERFWNGLKKEADSKDTVGRIIWERLKDSQTLVNESLNEAFLSDIEAVPIPLKPEARKKKQAVMDELNKKVLGDTTLAKDVLANADTVAFIQKSKETMREGNRLGSLLERHKLGRLLDDDMKELNRLLLEAYYRWAIWERAIVRRSVVIGRDQNFRAVVLGLSAAVALLASLVVGLNSTSLHGIYRRQLAQVYLEPVGKEAPDIPLHKLNTTEQGTPYHLLSGSLNKDSTQQENDHRPTAHFLFSRRYCGSLETGFIRSEEYLDGEMDLATAMAISGAAFSPTRVDNRLIAFLMVILNVRLGQWLPGPRYPRRVRWLPMLRLLVSLVLHRSEEQRRYWFISDGGHSENLGLGPLLRRECQLMIVSDAGYDPDYGFDDFVRLYRHARIKGVRFRTLDQSGFIRFDPLVPDKSTGFAPHRYVIARVDYPGTNKWGLLIYIKPSFAGDEGVDLTRYRKTNAAFPHDPTVNQWFNEDQVESYRELGAWIGRRASELLLEELFFKRHEHPGDFEEVAQWVRDRIQDTKEKAAKETAAVLPEVEDSPDTLRKLEPAEKVMILPDAK